jgi:hypothetical protein
MEKTVQWFQKLGRIANLTKAKSRYGRQGNEKYAKTG